MSILDWARGQQRKDPWNSPITSLGEVFRLIEVANVAAIGPIFRHSGNLQNFPGLVGGGGEILGPTNADDIQRAEQVVNTLRDALAKYKDYRVAIADGFVPLHPERKAPHYHFANKQRFVARLHFDAAAPTALLYTKTENGYELEGAMYTAPRGMTEDQLNERVPLSVAQWHAHINLCFPPEGNLRRGSLRLFGFKGTIATESECQQAGGRFVPQLGGWMIHVYPFKATSAAIWTH